MPPVAPRMKPLTSLRFFAAMMIVVHHATEYFDWRWLTHAPYSLVQGVSFFFVLSGFILTAVYGERGHFHPRAFMAARVARIFPAHVAAMLLPVLILPWSVINTGPDGLAAKIAVFFLKLTLMDALVLAPGILFSWNGVSWSLSTEMCFYLLFPLLLCNLDVTWVRKLLAAALLAATSILLCRLAGLRDDTPNMSLSVVGYIYANPVTRLFEFCLGMSACSLWRRYFRDAKLGFGAWTAIEAATLALLALAIAYAYALASLILPVGLYAWFGIAGLCGIFAITILVFANGAGLFGHILSWRWMVYLGEISFSIYLVNMTIMLAVRHNDIKFMTSETGFFVVLLASAALLHEAVEKPARALILSRLTRPRADQALGEATPAGR